MNNAQAINATRDERPAPPLRPIPKIGGDRTTVFNRCATNQPKLAWLIMRRTSTKWPTSLKEVSDQASVPLQQVAEQLA